MAVISDMDQTLIPAHDGATIPPPFAGVAALLGALNVRAGDTQQNIFYVTARDADSASPLPCWLAQNGLPRERVDSGGGPDREAATQGKLKDICAIIKAQPQRKFVLIGDSSHVDAEVYHEVSRRFPEQVEAVFIHNIENISRARTRGQFVFDSYAQVATELRNRGLLDNAAWAHVVKEVHTRA